MSNAPDSETNGPRRRQVLDASLRLLVRGEGLTMNAVAAEANCSKETLYKWFGDRKGLLEATVRQQASRVHVAPLEESDPQAGALIERLRRFAGDWLRVVSGETSLALNRLAIGQAAGAANGLGAVVLENGRFALAARLKPVLEAGRAAGLIGFTDAEQAFRTFFGLIARDVHIRLLLGDRMDLSEAVIAEEAERAVAQFIQLHPPRRESSN